MTPELELSEVRLSAYLTAAPEISEHGGAKTHHMEGVVFTPAEIAWWAFPTGAAGYLDRVVSGVTLYGERQGGRIPTVMFRRGTAGTMPAWVPAPPMGWDAFEAMVDGRAEKPQGVAS